MCQFWEFLSPQNQSNKNPESVSRGRNFAQFQIIYDAYLSAAGHRIHRFGWFQPQNCGIGTDHWWTPKYLLILSPCHLLTHHRAKMKPTTGLHKGLSFYSKLDVTFQCKFQNDVIVELWWVFGSLGSRKYPKSVLRMVNVKIAVTVLHWLWVIYYNVMCLLLLLTKKKKYWKVG